MTTKMRSKAIERRKDKRRGKIHVGYCGWSETETGNFKVEPLELFHGWGEHPKMGKLKKYINPNDITINIGKDASILECPIPGHGWKEVKNDKIVTWLAFWYNLVNLKEFKYVFWGASSSLKGQSDMEKYEKARMLKIT
ncbi:hypothetical protein SUGI_0222520 [Cryptomeria japonica]|nr:hypothetical protein SUGI_0222520 [Cryptomeria japonica]